MKKYYILSLLLIVLKSHLVFAQQLELTWSKTIGSTGWDWVNTSLFDKNYNCFLAGGIAGNFVNDTLISNPSENSNAFIAKCDTSGNIVWQKSFGGKLFDNVTTMAIAGDFIFIGGMFQDTMVFGNTKIVSNSFTNSFLACISTDGSPVWIKAISDRSQISSLSLAATPAGRIFMAGSFKDTLVLDQKILTSTGKYSIFLTEVKPAGNFINPIRFPGGGFISQPALSCNENTICIAGFFADSLQIKDTILYSVAQNDFFLASLKLDGNLRWSQSGGGSGDDKITAITLLKDGDIALLGNFEQTISLAKGIYTANGCSDLFLACFDSTGKSKWVTTLGGVADDFGHSLTEGLSGNIYVAGSFRRGILLGYGSDKQDQEEYKNLSGFGNAFIAKYNQNGVLKSSTYLPGSSEDYCKSLLVDKNGSVLATGNFFNTMELSGHTGGYSTSHTASGDKDIFIASFTDRCLKFKFNLGNDTAMCKGVPIVIKVNNNYDAYLWRKDGSTMQSCMVYSPGTYAVKVTDKYGCEASDSLVVTLNAKPFAYAGNDTTMLVDNEVKISGSFVSKIETLHWSTTGSGIFDDPSILHPTYLPSAADIKTGEVGLVLSAENKCEVVNDTLLLKINLGDKDIIAYPNPTIDKIYISSNIDGILNLALTDSHGSVLIQKKLKELKDYTLDLGSYPVGSYLIKVTTKKQVMSLPITKVSH